MQSRFKITCLYRLGQGTQKHQLIDLQTANKVTFGRGDRNDVILDESKAISRQHMVLEREPDTHAWTILDLNSGNGVHVNNEKLLPGVSVPLTDRDIIEIGRDPCSSSGTTYCYQYYTKARVQVKSQSQDQKPQQALSQGSDIPVVHLVEKDSSEKVELMEEALRSMKDEADSAINVISKLQDCMATDAKDKERLEAEKSEQEERLMKAQERIGLQEKRLKGLQQTLLKELHTQETRFQDEKQQLQQEMSMAMKKQAKDMEEMLAKLKLDEDEKIRKLEDKNTEMCVNFEEVMESELVCAICSEYFIQATSLNCSHSFCKLCINTWMETKRECPQCRTKITSQVNSLVLDNYIDRALEQMSPEAQETRKKMRKEREEAQKKLEAAKTNANNALRSNTHPHVPHQRSNQPSSSTSSSSSSNAPRHNPSHRSQRPLLQGHDRTNRRFHNPGQLQQQQQHYNQQRTLVDTPERDAYRQMYATHATVSQEYVQVYDPNQARRMGNPFRSNQGQGHYQHGRNHNGW